MTKLKIVTNFGLIICSKTNVKWSKDCNTLNIKTNAINLHFPKDLVIRIDEYIKTLDDYKVLYHKRCIK